MNKTGGGFIHRKRQGVLLAYSNALASLARCHIVEKKKELKSLWTGYLFPKLFLSLLKRVWLVHQRQSIQSFNKVLELPFLPFSVFIHWSLEYACQSHSISHSNPYSSTAFVAYLGFINLLVAQRHPVMLLFCQLLIDRDEVHQPNSESPAGAQSENRDCSKQTGVASGMCFVNLVKSIKYLKHYINSRTLTRHNEIRLRASSPFGRTKRPNLAWYAREQRSRERRRNGELATISHKFSCLLRLDEARYHWTAIVTLLICGALVVTVFTLCSVSVFPGWKWKFTRDRCKLSFLSHAPPPLPPPPPHCCLVFPRVHSCMYFLPSGVFASRL